MDRISSEDMDNLTVSVGLVALTSITMATAAFLRLRKGTIGDTSIKEKNSRNEDEFEKINTHLQNDLKKHILEKINDVKGDVNVKKMQMNKRIEKLLKDKEAEIELRHKEFLREKEAIETKYKEEIEKMTEELETEITEMKDSIKNLRVILADSTEDAERVKTTKSELECPVCLEEMRPPRRIWQCSDGHPVCERCRKKPAVTCCPTCRKYIVGRSTIAEKLARSLFTEDGTEQETSHGDGGKITLTGYREVKIEREAE